MKRFAALIIPLLLVVGIVVWVRTSDVVVAHFRQRFHEMELVAAYPAFRLDASIGTLAHTQPPHVESLNPESVTFSEWLHRDFAVRWAWYTRPDHGWVRVSARAELALIGVGLAALFLRTVGRGLWFLLMLTLIGRGAKPGHSHGSAHWAAGPELARMRPRPGHADLVLGRVGRHLVSIPEHEQYEHLLLVAPTGAGKTSGVILPNLLAEPGTRSLVITDPKRELLRKTTPALRARYGADHLWPLDFLDATLSRGYNPLAYVVDAASADLFAQTWVRNTGESKDAFWSNAARTLIGAAALHLVATEEMTPPLVGLVDLLCSTPAEEVSATLRESPVPEVRRLARGFLANMAKNERLLGSVFTELPPRFTCLNIPAVRAVTGTNEIDFAHLAQTPTALYLALDPQYSRTLAPLTACFFLHFFTTLTSLAKAVPSGTLPVPVMAYLDEFGTVGHIPEFASRMATVRSAGIGCLLVVQDQAQLTKAYGEEDADTIKSNATTKLCLARVTRDDAEYFSALGGTSTVYSTNRSSSRPLLLPWADRGNRGVGESQRALITPDELRTMHDEVFVVAGDRNPVRARQRRYYEEPTLARLVPDTASPDPLIALRRAIPLPVPTIEPAVPSGEGDEYLPEEAAPLSHPSPVTVATITAPLPEPEPDTQATVQPLISTSAPAVEAVPEQLTAAEITLLVAMADMPGATSAEIADRIGIAASTVRKRQGAIRAKLGGEDGDLVALARRHELLGNTMTATDVNTVFGEAP